MRDKLRTRLQKIEERVAGSTEVLRLPSGDIVRFSSEDALEALGAAIDGTDHWLHRPLQQANVTSGLGGLVCALLHSGEQAEREWLGHAE